MLFTEEDLLKKFTISVYKRGPCANQDDEFLGSYPGISIQDIEEQKVISESDLKKVLYCPPRDATIFHSPDGTVIRIAAEG
jgi:hypothetical protein